MSPRPENHRNENCLIVRKVDILFTKEISGRIYVRSLWHLPFFLSRAPIQSQV